MTPITMSPRKKAILESILSLYRIAPATAVPTAPMPARMLYATPGPIVRTARDRRKRQESTATRVAAAHSGLRKLSDLSRKITHIGSRMHAAMR